MRVKGIGSVRQVKRKDGTPIRDSWQLTLSLGNDPLTGERRQPCRPFKGTKTAARRALDEFRHEVENGLKLDADKTTFGEYTRQWQESRKAAGRLAPASIVRENTILAHLMKHLDTVPLGDFDTLLVRGFYATLARDNVGQNTAAKAGALLKQILNQAVYDDVLLRNPCLRVDAPRRKKAKKGTALDKAGVARLMDALKDTESSPYPYAQTGQQKRTTDMGHVMAARLALAAGLRRGEALGLSWEDIDLTNAMLHVRHTLCNTSGELKAPKTDNSTRDIALAGQILTDLKRWKQRQAEYLFSLGVKQNGKTPVISNEIGGRLDGDNLARWWRLFQKRYHFEGLRFHDLRHCHATLLISSGLNMKAVSTRLGHSSIAITLDLYAHALREDDLKAAEVIGQIMAEPAPQMGQVVNL